MRPEHQDAASDSDQGYLSDRHSTSDAMASSVDGTPSRPPLVASGSQLSNSSLLVGSPQHQTLREELAKAQLVVQESHEEACDLLSAVDEALSKLKVVHSTRAPSVDFRNYPGISSGNSPFHRSLAPLYSCGSSQDDGDTPQQNPGSKPGSLRRKTDSLLLDGSLDSASFSLQSSGYLSESHGSIMAKHRRKKWVLSVGDQPEDVSDIEEVFEDEVDGVATTKTTLESVREPPDNIVDATPKEGQSRKDKQSLINWIETQEGSWC